MGNGTGHSQFFPLRQGETFDVLIMVGSDGCQSYETELEGANKRGVWRPRRTLILTELVRRMDRERTRGRTIFFIRSSFHLWNLNMMY